MRIRLKACAQCPSIYGYEDAEFADMIALYRRGLLKPSEIAYPCAFDKGPASVCAGLAQRAGFTDEQLASDERVEQLGYEIVLQTLV